MSDQLQAWSYAEEVSLDDPIAAKARHLGREYGIRSLSSATCAFLSYLAAVTNARNAVEIGTGAGVSGLALLRGSGGLLLTTIDPETETQAIARAVFAEAGFRTGLTRIIHGRSADIFPRLASNSYDLVLIDGDPLEAEGDVVEARRILRPGGSLILARALLGGLVADPTRREEEVVALRDLGRSLLEDPDLLTSVIPIGDGLIVAKLR